MGQVQNCDFFVHLMANHFLSSLSYVMFCGDYENDVLLASESPKLTKTVFS